MVSKETGPRKTTSFEGVVAIGFAEALSAPEVAWSLLDAGFKVIAFSRKGRRAALRQSRHVEIFDITPPEKDCAASARELESVLDAQRGEHRRALLLPLDDASLWLSREVKPATPWTLAGASGDGAEMALDKQKQTEAVKTAGLDVPDTSFASTREELFERVQSYPVILRPAHAVSVSEGRLRKGRNWICSNEGEFHRAAAAWNGNGVLMMQPFIQGTGEGVFGFATPDGVVGWSAHRRVRMMNPHGSGSSACASQEVPDDVKGPIEAFLRSCGWRGMFMIEFLRAQDGRLWFVEFNGRAWGSMALSRRQGLEYPAWTVQQALNPDFIPNTRPREDGEILCQNVGREMMHLLFVLRGPQSHAIRNWPKFWGSLSEMARPDHSRSLYNWRRDDWRVFVSDCWCTVRDQVFKSR